MLHQKGEEQSLPRFLGPHAGASFRLRHGQAPAYIYRKRSGPAHARRSAPIATNIAKLPVLKRPQ